MGGNRTLDPGAILADLVIAGVMTALSSNMVDTPGAPAPQTDVEAEAERLAEEREAKARRAEDRRAEEAVLRAQSQKQKLSQSRQNAGLATSLGDGGTLAGESMHGAARIAAPQLKEKLGQ